MTDNDDKKYYDCRCGRSGNTSHEQDLGGLAIAGGYDVKLSEVHGMAQRGGSGCDICALWRESCGADRGRRAGRCHYRI